MRRAKRVLVNENYLDKFYPHSILTLTIQMHIAFNETEKFAKWCDSDLNSLLRAVIAIREIFEVENNDDITWMAELLSNKHVTENIDRLLYIVATVKR
jgi:hypothetical protein